MTDISVIIPTRRRPESLALTLESLAMADRRGITVEVTVVENDDAPRSEFLSQKYTSLNLRHYVETRPGKSYAMNCALNEGVSGQIIVSLDDDISVETNWFRGVVAVTKRWPNKGYYTGRSRIQWPAGPLPAWRTTGSLQGWAYSVLDYGDQDHEIPNWQWASGNFFWFRAEVLNGGRRFLNPSDNQMESDAQFMLQLAAEGLGGVAGPEPVVWHRVQRELLEVENLKARARCAGRAFAAVRLHPYRPSNSKACQFRDHPLLARAYCLGQLLRTYAAWWRIRLFGSADQTGHGIHLEHLIAYYWELLRIAGRMPEYRLRLLPRRLPVRGALQRLT